MDDVEVHRSRGIPGVAATLNEGLKQCRAEWVARLDADDVAHPERLMRQLAASSGVSVLGTRMIAIREHETPIWHPIPEPPSLEDVSPRELLRSNALVHSSVLLSRAAVEEVGGYRTDVGSLEDYDLWLRLCSRRPVKRLAAPLVAYRLHGAQATRKRRRAKDQWALFKSRIAAADSVGIHRGVAIMAQFGYTVEHAALSVRSNFERSRTAIDR